MRSLRQGRSGRPAAVVGNAVRRPAIQTSLAQHSALSLTAAAAEEHRHADEANDLVRHLVLRPADSVPVRSLILVVLLTLVACANPVDTRLVRTPADPPAERMSAFSAAELLAAAESASASGSTSRRRAFLYEILRRLPDERESFESAGLQSSGAPAELAWVPADAVEFSGLSRRYERDGIGVPLSVEQSPRAAIGAAEFPPEGDNAPSTAVLSFRTPGCAVLSFIDPRQFESVATPDGAVPLAADFTAPFARLLDNTSLVSTGRLAILDPFSEKRRGLFLLEPYDPEKTPLVMVHGLGSSPMAWRELTNTIFGTPELRRRYQVWHYFYPTGTPYLWAAREFRDTLVAARRDLRKKADEPAQQDTVLVGHSMGGMLVKTTVETTERALWDRVFEVPPGALRVTDDQRRVLKEIFIFEPLPFVTRAVFVMSPHRGSQVADSWFAGLGITLVSLPNAFTTLFQSVMESHPEGVRPAFREMFSKGGPSSIRALRSDYPLFPTLAEIPVDDRVPFHVIAGDGGDGTDGVVSLESALLDGAASTQVLEAAHTDLESPQVSEALAQILKRHGSSSSTPPDRSYEIEDCAPASAHPRH